MSAQSSRFVAAIDDWDGSCWVVWDSIAIVVVATGLTKASAIRKARMLNRREARS